MVVGLGGQAQGVHRRRRLLRSALVAHHREHDNQDGNHDKRSEDERDAVARHGALKHGHVGEQKRRSCRKGNQDGGAKRSAHLVQRVLQGIRMLDNAVVQRVQAPGVQRRHDGLHAHAQAGVHEDDERHRRVQRKAYQAAPTDGGNGGTGDDNAARPQLVEQAAGEIAHNGTHHGARQHDKASAQRRDAQQVLQVDWQQHARAHQCGLQHGNHDNGGCVAAALQHGNLKQRNFQLELTAHEERKQHRANNDKRHRGKHVTGGGDGGQAVQQREQAQRAQCNRGFVKGSGFELAVALQEQDGKHHDNQRQREHHHEQRSPTDGIDQQTGNGRAHRRREADDQGNDAHGLAALLAREDKQDYREHHGHNHATGHGLQHAPQQ